MGTSIRQSLPPSLFQAKPLSVRCWRRQPICIENLISGFPWWSWHIFPVLAWILLQVLHLAAAFRRHARSFHWRLENVHWCERSLGSEQKALILWMTWLWACFFRQGGDYAACVGRGLVRPGIEKSALLITKWLTRFTLASINSKPGKLCCVSVCHFYLNPFQRVTSSTSEWIGMTKSVSRACTVLIELYNISPGLCDKTTLGYCQRQWLAVQFAC